MRISLVFVSGLLVGCIVTQISPVPQVSHGTGLQNTLKRLVIGIAQPDSRNSEITARQLQRSLELSGLFQKVGLVSELPQRPDLVLESYNMTRFGFPVGFQCFEPYLLVLSAGVIPQTCQSDVDLSFSCDALVLEQFRSIASILGRSPFLDGWQSH